MDSEVWRECVKWLTRCKALRPDHKLNWSDATIMDLAYALRDGVLLCNLLNILDSDTLDMKDVNQKPQMAQFLCLRNIKLFLSVCQNVYNLREEDLFEATMLFDLSDFHKILITLSKLSNCPKLEQRGIGGFTVHNVRTPSQEDIYKNLNSGTLGHEEYAAFESHVHNEEVYHHLCSVKKRNTIIIQVPSAIVPSIEKRDYVINELIETEKNYVEVLTTLQNSFMRPLNNVLEQADFRLVFFGIKELVETHSMFHKQLRKACASYSSVVKLSDVFLSSRHKFLIYGDYCANLTVAQDRILRLSSTNQLLNQEINRCEQEASNGKFKLRDILSVPMQRILKYHLLLDKLLSETSPHHDDYRGLERAKEAMIDVAQYINEVKRDSDTLHIIADIQHSIIDWNMPENTELKDFGHLLKDGEIKVRCYNNPKVKLRYVFIFDRVLLMCKSLRGDQYSLKGTLLLQEYKTEESIGRAISRDHSGRWSHQFYLVNKFHGEQIYTFYCRGEDARRKWMKAIQDALENMEPASGRTTEHRLSLHTFHQPTLCNYCSKYLKGRIFQGYRCSKCYLALHKECIINSKRCTPRFHTSLSVSRSLSLSSSNNPSPQSLSPLPPDWNQMWTERDLLSDYLWFVGEMGRDKADALLRDEIEGTFLVRIRPQGPTNANESVFALSLKSNNRVKHMKIYEKKHDTNGQSGQSGQSTFYLSESRFFTSLIELVSCYEQSSLAENFLGLDMKLQWPYRRIIAVAEFDFNPTEVNQLPLKKGCQVIVLSKEGDHKGWWKGQIQDRIGFFPKVYVREVSDTFSVREVGPL